MDTPRFLCDEMLGHLCRYLRAAGYDALLENNGAGDAELLRRCHDEGRFFLTQDTRIVEHKAAAGIALVLPHAPLDELANRVGARFGLDWLAHAFNRCLVDNTPLVPANEATASSIPQDARHPGEPLMHCPACRRTYWRGSHYKRMHARLVKWQLGRKTCST